MRRDIDGRLRALETSRFGSPRIAAYWRAVYAVWNDEAICAMSNEEPNCALDQAKAGLKSLTEAFSYAERDRYWKDFERALRAHQLLDATE